MNKIGDNLGKKQLLADKYYFLLKGINPIDKVGFANYNINIAINYVMYVTQNREAC